MSRQEPRIAIVGGGLSGLSAAALLSREGHVLTVYEQAPTFTHLGAGIHLGPNLVRVLNEIGVADRLKATGVQPDRCISRKWDTGEILLDFPLGKEARSRYGAPYLMVHRGDLHALLLESVNPERIQFGKKLVGIEPTDSCVHLTFEDGSTKEADVVIGCDGVRSRVREVLVGLERPRYSGQVAYRGTVPISRLRDIKLPDFTKWWADDRIILPYFIKSSRDEIYFVSSSPQADWPYDASFVTADLDEMRNAFVGFHKEVQAILNACTDATKWAQIDWEPLSLWSEGRIVLLGDACHPMTPYMGQGVAMAIEDAAMITRCIGFAGTDFEYAFCLYETNRKDRTVLIQRMSRLNTWLRDYANTWREGQATPDSVFGYDVFSASLSRPAHGGTSLDHVH